MDPVDGLTADLRRQVDRIMAHSRQGRFETRRRYREAGHRAAPLLADRFRLRQLANLQDKHLRAYVEARLAAGIAPATIRTDLAARRFLHDLAADARYRLSRNRDLMLQLPQRQHCRLGRGWSDVEFAALEGRALDLGQVAIALALSLYRHAGLRIHEALRLDWAAARRGLRNGELRVQGNGGRVRDVPLDRPARCAGGGVSAWPAGSETARAAGCQTHRAIAGVQAFLRRHRGRAERPDRRARLTVHGLRHTFAAERYRARMAAGDSRASAERSVSRLLGHNRPEVTRGYL